MIRSALPRGEGRRAEGVHGVVGTHRDRETSSRLGAVREGRTGVGCCLVPGEGRREAGADREEAQQRRGAWAGSRAAWVQSPAAPLSSGVDAGTSLRALRPGILIFKTETMRIVMLIFRGAPVRIKRVKTCEVLGA